MKVKNVEVLRAPRDLFQHEQVRGQRILAGTT
jgi:hypothetical protein